MVTDLSYKLVAGDVWEGCTVRISAVNKQLVYAVEGGDDGEKVGEVGLPQKRVKLSGMDALMRDNAVADGWSDDEHQFASY